MCASSSHDHYAHFTEDGDNDQKFKKKLQKDTRFYKKKMTTT